MTPSVTRAVVAAMLAAVVLAPAPAGAAVSDFAALARLRANDIPGMMTILNELRSATRTLGEFNVTFPAASVELLGALAKSTDLVIGSDALRESASRAGAEIARQVAESPGVAEVVALLPLAWAGWLFAVAGAAVVGLAAWSVWTLGGGLLRTLPWITALRRAVLAFRAAS